MLDFLPPIWHGTLREHYVVLFGAAGTIALFTGLVGAWIGARIGARRLMRKVLVATADRDAQHLAGAQATSAQLAELARAVDVVAIEVERLAEGQRFTAKLLAERGEQALPPRSPRQGGVVTPH